MASLGAAPLKLPAVLEFTRQAQPSTPTAVAAVAQHRRRMSDSCVRTHSARSLHAARSCSPTASAGFGLRVARAAQSPAPRSRHSSFGLLRRQSSSFVPMTFCLPSQLVEVKDASVAAVKSAQTHLQDGLTQVIADLTPPRHLSSSTQPRPTFLIGLCSLMVALSLIMTISAFHATPDLKEEDCQWFHGISRTLQVGLMSWLMFAAGALLALEHPVRWEMLRAI